MEGKAWVVCIVVAALGLIATVVGVFFEIASVRTQEHLFYFEYTGDPEFCRYNCWQCVYFRSPAFFLVVAAIICAFVAQLIITTATDCGCCRGRFSSSAFQALAILAFFFSWLACITSILLYLVGGAKHSGVQFHLFSSSNQLTVDNGQCYKVKHGIFAGAAASSLGATILGIVSYLAIIYGEGRRRRRIIQAHERHGSTEVHNSNNGNPPRSPADAPVGIELIDVPARSFRRTTPVQPHNVTPAAYMPVMVEA